MTNYWYVARDNEIFVDMDKPESSLPHAEVRLSGAIVHGKLSVKSIETHPSQDPAHLHAVITLNNNMPPTERAIWALMFHSDIYRGMSTLMRIFNNVDASDILITPTPFSRFSDTECECYYKHDAKTMDVCPAAIRLRGKYRTASFFGKPEPVPANGTLFNKHYRVLISNVQQLSDKTFTYDILHW